MHELFGGGLNMTRRGWRTALGPGRHPISSCYFWYFHSPCGGAAEYDFDSDVVDERWVPGQHQQSPEVFAEWCLAEGMADSLLYKGVQTANTIKTQRLTRTERNGSDHRHEQTTRRLRRHPRHLGIRRRACSPGLSLERIPVLVDESGEPRRVPRRRAQVSAEISDDRGAARRRRERAWNQLLELGGVSYALAKLAFTDKKSYQFMASQMVGIPESEYVKMMLAGGRSPDGWRSKSERKG